MNRAVINAGAMVAMDGLAAKADVEMRTRNVAVENDEPHSRAAIKRGTSKYLPHTGAKQLAKAAARAARKMEAA